MSCFSLMSYTDMHGTHDTHVTRRVALASAQLNHTHDMGMLHA